MLIVFAFLGKISAQNVEYLSLDVSGKLAGSPCNTIEFIDSRADTTDFGSVFSDDTRRVAPVALKTQLSLQMSFLFYKLTDSAAANGIFVFQLRKLKFSEIVHMNEHQGIGLFRADAYLKNDIGCFKLASTDQVINVSDNKQGTAPALFHALNDSVIDFIVQSLGNYRSAKPCNCADVASSEDQEKSRLQLYTATRYPDAVYYSYGDFRDQRSAQTIVKLVSRYGKIKKLVVKDSSGKEARVRVKNAYAFAYNNQPYIVSEESCYPLSKRDNNFFFNKLLPVYSKTDEFNMLEYVLARYKNGIYAKVSRGPGKKFFELKLDHFDGGFDVVRPLHYLPLTK